MVFKRHHNWSLLTALLLTVITVFSCSPDEFVFTQDTAIGRTEAQPSVRAEVPNYKNVFIIYSMGYNNLTYYLQTNIKDIFKNPISSNPRDVLLILSHFSKGYNYSTPTNPTLTKITQDPNGNIQKDTLLILPSSKVTTTPEVLNEVLSYVHENFEAERYGMLMSSHGSGWVPAQYLTKGESIGNRYDGQAKICQQAMAETFEATGIYRERLPLTKSIGAHFPEYNSIEIEITDLAKAIPFKLDYLIFDACFMGGIEVAYELRHTTDKIIASQTEILGDGMHYPSLCSYIFANKGPQLESICQKYYELYDNQSGIYRSATISLLDCTKIEALAKVTSEIISNHRKGLAEIQASRKVQKYFRESSHQWFYDFQDIITNCGLTEEESSAFESALEDVVIYKAATKYFMNSIAINNHSGLSMYLPFVTGRDNLNKFYKTLEWNNVTGLLQ